LTFKQKITIKDIEANIHIGVTENERINKQKILLTIEIIPLMDVPPKRDNIEETINYSEIRIDVLKILNSKVFNLLETLCLQIAKKIKDDYNVKEVSVTIKKFPYKDVDYVSYSLTI